MKHVTTLTGEPLDSLSPELAKQEAERIEALQRLRGLRKEAAAEIERLLDFMDASDLDPDLEPDDEGDDAELEEDDPAEDDGLREPSLGSLENYGHGDGEWWACSGRNDLEDEHDGAEPDECGEPSLGSLDRVMNQEQSWQRDNPLSADMEEGAI